MLDVKLILENPDLVKAKLKERLKNPEVIDQVVSLYNEKRKYKKQRMICAIKKKILQKKSVC